MSKNMTVLRFHVFSAAALLATAATVAVAGPSATESDFGNSVRNMIEQQTYDPEAAARPAKNPPEVLDGERAAAVIKAYRTVPPRDVRPDPPLYLRDMR